MGDYKLLMSIIRKNLSAVGRVYSRGGCIACQARFSVL